MDSRQSIELEINPNYSLTPPILERLVFTVIPDQTSRLTNLKTGNIDLLQYVPPHEVADLQTNYPKIRVLAYDGSIYNYIGWLNTNHCLMIGEFVAR